jgi:hypothetical protein
MSKALSRLILAACFCFMQGTSADTVFAQEIEWGGSVKSLNIYGEEAPADLFPEYKLSSNRARLEATWRTQPNWQIETALDYQYLWSDPAEAFELSDSNINRHLGLDNVYSHGNAGSSRLQLDRINLQYARGPLDVTIGRQAIGFGRILIFSPLDVIAPFAPDAIDTDVRIGVDAARTIYNYGLDGQAGVIAVWGDEERNNSYLGTWTDNMSSIDLLLIGGRLRGRDMIGAGLAGSLGTLGLKGEISFHQGRDLNTPGGDLYDNYAIGAIEGWYRFDNGISLVLEYLYNGPGSDQPEEYLQVLNSAPLQEGLTYLLGKHYLMLAPSYEIHPLATLQGLAILNLQDESALVRPTLDLSLSDNLSLQLFWTLHKGEGPQVINPLLPVIPKSEFGLRGDSGGLFCKWFF